MLAVEASVVDERQRLKKLSFTSTREKLVITRKTVTDSSTLKLRSKRSTVNLKVVVMTKDNSLQNETMEFIWILMSKGHAGYAEEGQDIVCAAVSALVINTVNSR